VGSAGAPGSFLPPVIFAWDFGDGTSDTGNVVNHVYSNNGAYVVTLTVTDANGCTSSTTQNVTVHTTSAHFTVTSTSSCVTVNGIRRANVEATFVSDSTAYTNNATYDWDFTVYRDSTSVLSTYLYNYSTVPPGTYDATLILTNDLGCRDTFTMVGAVIVPGPTGSFSFIPDSGCTPLQVHFNGSSANTNIFAWDFGDGAVVTGTSATSISHVYNSPGVYTPQFLLGFQLQNDFCYIPVDTIGDVIVTSLLAVDILEDSILIPTVGGSAPVTVVVNDPNNLGPPYTYNWNPASDVTQGSASNIFNISSDLDSAYYTVSIPYGAQGCAGVDSVLVFGAPCEFDWDSIPNVFTPNGDFKNDTYFIKDLCNYDGFYIRIYNRWGKIIYESTDPRFEWDGTTTSGSEASDGVYYYVMKTKKRDDLHGWIELIRSPLN